MSDLENCLAGCAVESQSVDVRMDDADSQYLVCLVCAAEAHGIHFQVNSCRACAAFFRRSAQIASSYKCRRASKNCDVRKDSKFNCRYCRYQKCLRVGMLMNVQERAARAESIEIDDPAAATSLSSSVEVDTSSPAIAPKVSFDRHNLRYDVKPLIETLTAILNGAATPFPAAKGIRPTAMQRLQFGFQMFRGSAKPFRVHGKIKLEETMNSFEDSMVKIAKWAMICEEFVALEWTDKWLVFKHLWPIFYPIERVAYTIVMLGNDTNDTHMFIDNETAIDMSTVVYDIPESARENLEKFFKPHNEMMVKNLITPLKQLRLSEYELVYLMAQILWSVKSCPGVSDKAGQVGEKFLDAISNEIHNYYVYELRLDNYAARLTKIIKILSEVEKENLYKKDLMTVADVFNIFRCDIYDSELL